MLFWQISSAFSPGANFMPFGKIPSLEEWELCINDRSSAPASGVTVAVNVSPVVLAAGMLVVAGGVTVIVTAGCVVV